MLKLAENLFYTIHSITEQDYSFLGCWKIQKEAGTLFKKKQERYFNHWHMTAKQYARFIRNRPRSRLSAGQYVTHSAPSITVHRKIRVFKWKTALYYYITDTIFWQFDHFVLFFGLVSDYLYRRVRFIQIEGNERKK